VCKSSIEFERKYQALTHTIIMMIFPVTLKFRRLGGSSMERELKNLHAITHMAAPELGHVTRNGGDSTASRVGN
jgi:hypothetical protein